MPDKPLPEGKLITPLTFTHGRNSIACRILQKGLQGNGVMGEQNLIITLIQYVWKEINRLITNQRIKAMQLMPVS